MAVEADPDAAPRGVGGCAVRDTWTSLRSVFGNPALRRIELALAGSMIGDWAYATAVVVWAYGVGGARLVGIWGAVRLLLMAFASPIGSVARGPAAPQDRAHRQRPAARRCSPSSRPRCLALDAPAAVVLVVATAALARRLRLPPGPDGVDAVAHPRPEELTAANGASSTIESLAFFVGPALGALLVTTTSVQVVFLPQRRHVPAVRRPRVGHPRRSPARTRATTPTTATAPTPSDEPEEKVGMLAEMAGGFPHIRARPAT